MSITIIMGKSGRMVIPMPIRERLGIREGSRVRIEVLGGKLEVVPEPDELKITLQDGFPLLQNRKPGVKGETTAAIQQERDARDARLATRGNPR